MLYYTILTLDPEEPEFQQVLSLVRALIKKSAQDFQSKIRLFVYLVGTSENIKTFFSEDPVIESLVGHQVINLNAGYGNEFELIRTKIDERLKGAFKGYGNFDNAWNEIRNLLPNPSQTLRGFCQEYAFSILGIYDNYFKEKPEQEFEGNARKLVEAQCKQQWQSYLNQKAYTLSSVSTTTILEGHAFDCYVELLHNGTRAARCFGEAKNYELLSSHLETFNRWLEDVKFKPSTVDAAPPDLAFMIAPSCPSLLKRKLELKNIHFIPADKIIDPLPITEPPPAVNILNINIAQKDLIVAALKGTGIRGTTVDKRLFRI